jgi:photosystem II stability/assembly factor-like uncharacterized protein
MPRIISGMARIRLHLCLLLLTVTSAGAQTAAKPPSSPVWTLQSSHTTASLRGIHAVNSQIAWASGTAGTIIRTLDGGRHWRPCATPPKAAKLDFRAIWAFDARTAWAMSSGPGNLSRLYKTTDGCAHWTLLATNQAPNGFWDAMTLGDQNSIEILGDPVGGRFVEISSRDGGRTWNRMNDPGLKSLPKEGAFAASNSSLVKNWDDGTSYFGTGGPRGARLFYECDPCKRIAEFTASTMPMFPASAYAGIFSIAYRFSRRGKMYIIAVGGDYTQPSNPKGTAAWSTDEGLHWHAATHPPHGYRSTVAWAPKNHAWITAGTNGSDISFDNGNTWQPIGNGNWNAISLPFIVGPKGRIGRLNSARLPK